jgi:hypothetical protein
VYKRKYGKKRRRKNKNSGFSVFPLVRVNLGHPHRVAMVYWGKGSPKEYRLDYLDPHELRSFWRMSKSEMAEYLRKFFNRHHRKPRCQKGVTEISNLSYVDIVSHVSYNSLICVVGRWTSLSVEIVKTVHIESFLRQFYLQLEKVFTESGKVKTLEAVINPKNINNLGPHLLSNIAKWAGVDSTELHVSHVIRFFEKIYPPLRRLAYEHDHRRFKTMYHFMKSLNEVWLPKDEQINLRR